VGRQIYKYNRRPRHQVLMRVLLSYFLFPLVAAVSALPQMKSSVTPGLAGARRSTRHEDLASTQKCIEFPVTGRHGDLERTNIASLVYFSETFIFGAALGVFALVKAFAATHLGIPPGDIDNLGFYTQGLVVVFDEASKLEAPVVVSVEGPRKSAKLYSTESTPAAAVPASND